MTLSVLNKRDMRRQAGRSTPVPLRTFGDNASDLGRLIAVCTQFLLLSIPLEPKRLSEPNPKPPLAFSARPARSSGSLRCIEAFGENSIRLKKIPFVDGNIPNKVRRRGWASRRATRLGDEEISAEGIFFSTGPIAQVF